MEEKKILEIIQVNYQIESVKDLVKDTLQKMMNIEFESSMGYKK